MILTSFVTMIHNSASIPIYSIAEAILREKQKN